MTYLRQVSTRHTPQSQPILGSNQVPNSAGGYAWAVDDWTRLDRFLILGSEGATYYASEQKLTRENAEAVMRCIKADGARVVNRIVEVSEAGRAPKNNPAIFALAMASALGDDATRKLALEALPKVCRIGTHIMNYCSYVEGFRGWGRGLRRAIGAWYNAKSAKDAAFQAVKYQSRDKWSQRDLLRLSHPVPASEQHKAVYHWITQGWEGVGEEPHPDEALRLIWAFERAKVSQSDKEIVKLIREYRLPREAVPTQWLVQPNVWEALLEDMPMTALIRNLATMTRVGLLKPMGTATKKVIEQLGDKERLGKARVHPIAVLSALKTYEQGHGERSNNTWQPVAQIVDALDGAFYASFGNVTPTGKRYVLALDISGSMNGGAVAGVPGLTPRVASAAMALITASTESNWTIVGFTNGTAKSMYAGYGSGITPLTISPRQRLDDVIRYIAGLPFGGTDCALPMLWAEQNKIEADAFVIFTDNETWYGKIHPAQALVQYRQKMGIPAKLIVTAMVGNEFSIADADDGGMLDCVGFDAATPNLISEFVV